MGFVSQHCIGFMLTHVISSAIAIVQAMQSITGVPPGSEQREDYESQYDCNICFAVASAPVVTLYASPRVQCKIPSRKGSQPELVQLRTLVLLAMPIQMDAAPEDLSDVFRLC